MFAMRKPEPSSSEGRSIMFEEIELLQEPDLETAGCYVEQVDLDELRRYVALDMARMLGSLPDKAVKLAESIDRFLQGKSLRNVNE